jgi:RNA polymerase sigma factor (sigma-70 family)
VKLRPSVELFPAVEHEQSVANDHSGLLAHSSDDALWQESSTGDGSAFAALYERHARKIYNYLFRRLADWSEAEDLTAVVFLEAFRRRSDVVVVEGKLLPWLYGIATNVLRNRRRAQWRHRHLLAQLAGERDRNAAPDLDARVGAAEQMRSVLDKLADLPRSQQDVVALCVWSGLSYDEAAAALGIPVGTVRSRLSRARASLAELNLALEHELVDVEQKGIAKPR